MTAQLNPAPIVVEHYRALTQLNGRLSVGTLVEQIGLPIAAAVVAFHKSMKVSASTGIALVTLSGLFAAFFLQLTVQLLDRAASWSESKPVPSEATSRYARLLTSLAANAGYSNLVAILCATAAVAVTISQAGWQERLLACLMLGLFVHMAMTMLVTVRRVFVTTAARLRDIRTGVNVDDPTPLDRSRE